MRPLFAVVLALTVSLVAAEKRAVNADDQFRFLDVGDPQISPDGEWVLYTVTSTDVAADRRNSDIWRVKWDGSQRSQITFSTENENAPQWSPDGKYISFLSSRPGPMRGTQVWVIERGGGEARQLTQIRGGVTSYQWSPDSTRLALVRRDSDEPDEAPAGRGGAAPPPDKPIVIDKYQFKRDGPTYLTGNARTRVFVYDIASKTLDHCDGDRRNPEWSPTASRRVRQQPRRGLGSHPQHRRLRRRREARCEVATLTTFNGADGVSRGADGKLIAYGKTAIVQLP